MPEWLPNLLKENGAAGRLKAQRYGEMTGDIRGLLRVDAKDSVGCSGMGRQA